jgi:PTH1 family peptidyl-tRNA hydrolase
LSSQDDNRLIIGLGNPGARYERTRHNYGFMVVEALASTLGLSFKSPLGLTAKLASGTFSEKKVFLLLPQTYMNLSGQAVAKFMRHKNLSTSSIIVVVDDVAIPFGKMRLRPKGSSGGHNGLVSIEQALRTQNYLRLRMGIHVDHPQRQPLDSFVLGSFSKEEQDKLPELIDCGVKLLQHWLSNGTESALQQAGSMT